MLSWIIRRALQQSASSRLEPSSPRPRGISAPGYMACPAHCCERDRDALPRPALPGPSRERWSSHRINPDKNVKSRDPDHPALVFSSANRHSRICKIFRIVRDSTLPRRRVDFRRKQSFGFFDFAMDAATPCEQSKIGPPLAPESHSRSKRHCRTSLENTSSEIGDFEARSAPA